MTKTQREIQSIIQDEIKNYGEALSEKSKFRRCFFCHEPFKLTKRTTNRYYCNSSCGRKAHYISFRIKSGI